MENVISWISIHLHSDIRHHCLNHAKERQTLVGLALKLDRNLAGFHIMIELIMHTHIVLSDYFPPFCEGISELIVSFSDPIEIRYHQSNRLKNVSNFEK